MHVMAVKVLCSYGTSHQHMEPALGELHCIFMISRSVLLHLCCHNITTKLLGAMGFICNCTHLD